MSKTHPHEPYPDRDPLEITYDITYSLVLNKFSKRFELDPNLKAAQSHEASALYQTGSPVDDLHLERLMRDVKLASIMNITHAFDGVYGEGDSTWWHKDTVGSKDPTSATGFAGARTLVVSRQHPVLGLIEHVNAKDFAAIPNYKAADLFEPLSDQAEASDQPYSYAAISDPIYDIVLRNRPVVPNLTKVLIGERNVHYTNSAQLAIVDVVLSHLFVFQAGPPLMREEASKLAEAFKPHLFTDDATRKYKMLSDLCSTITSIGNKIEDPASDRLLNDMYHAGFAFRLSLVKNLCNIAELCDETELPTIPFSKESAGLGALSLSRLAQTDTFPPVDLPLEDPANAELLDTVSEEALAAHALSSAELTTDIQQCNKFWKAPKADTNLPDIRQLGGDLVQGKLAVLGKRCVSRQDALLMRDVLVVLDRNLNEPDGLQHSLNIISETLRQQTNLEERRRAHVNKALTLGLEVDNSVDIIPVRQLLEWMCAEKETVCTFIWKTWAAGGRKQRFQAFLTSLEQTFAAPANELPAQP